MTSPDKALRRGSGRSEWLHSRAHFLLACSARVDGSDTPPPPRSHPQLPTYHPPHPQYKKRGRGGRVTSCMCDLSAATVDMKLPSCVWPQQVFALCRSLSAHLTRHPQCPAPNRPPHPTPDFVSVNVCVGSCRFFTELPSSSPCRSPVYLQLFVFQPPHLLTTPPPTPASTPKPLAQVFICQQQSLKQVSVSRGGGGRKGKGGGASGDNVF